jgi:hypothetical protein
MEQPVIYKVTPQQVGNEDINDFLRRALSKQFDKDNFCIVNEQTIDRFLNGNKCRLKAYVVEVENTSHTIYFDITDVGILNKTTWT